MLPLSTATSFTGLIANSTAAANADFLAVEAFLLHTKMHYHPRYRFPYPNMHYDLRYQRPYNEKVDI